MAKIVNNSEYNEFINENVYSNFAMQERVNNIKVENSIISNAFIKKEAVDYESLVSFLYNYNLYLLPNTIILTAFYHLTQIENIACLCKIV
jgi:hypothetical protein